MTTSPRSDALDSPAMEQPDALGDGWIARTLVLPPDAAGPDPVATLVYRAPTAEVAALYVHGFTDYFFQAEHAQTWVDHGIDFYALDLRRNGRSLRSNDEKGDVRDLRDYAVEIAQAVDIIRTEHGHRAVVLVGHSMGGLITSLYVHDHPGTVDALVLNNPWFGLNEALVTRLGGRAIAEVSNRINPLRVVGKLRPDYARALHSSTGGTWAWELNWKPIEGFPVRAGWLRAILRGQARLFGGLDLDVPVLVCTSGRSSGTGGRRAPEAEILTTDIVLNVRDAWRGAQHLGDDVTVVAIPGSVHDLALSAETPRADYERTVFSWLSGRDPSAP